MPDPTSPDLSIVIVSWNVRELVAGCLRSVVSRQESGIRGQESGSESRRDLTPDACSLTPEIIVVDNASADGSAAMVAAEFPDVRLIVNTENVGFTRGNNQGLAIARGRHVFFLNPDTEVVGDALAMMLAYMDAHPKVGALGPQLRYGDGSLQSSKRRFPTFVTALFESTPLAWHWPANPWARRYRMEDRSKGADSAASTTLDSVRLTAPSTSGRALMRPSAQGAQSIVMQSGVREGHDNATQYAGMAACQDTRFATAEKADWLVGAALMVRREVLAQIGGFDEGYFMYSEELDLCRRIEQAGWQIVYLPAAQIIHYEGKSSKQNVAARHIRFQTSKVRYFRKFHGPVQAEALRVFILALFAVEWALEAGKWLLGSKRPLRRERMAAYGQLLSSGLRDWGPGTGDQESVIS